MRSWTGAIWQTGIRAAGVIFWRAGTTVFLPMKTGSPKSLTSPFIPTTATPHPDFMHVFYEDSGQFKAEKVLSRATSTLQVEAASGRRSKIRAANVLFEFDAPTPAELMTQAQATQEAFDMPCRWECALQEDIEVATFAEDYFGETPTPIQKAALVTALHSAPTCFNRRGKGRYLPATHDILEAAHAAIKK